MKKRIFIYTVIAVVAGIFTGIVISSIIYKDNDYPSVPELITGEDNEDNKDSGKAKGDDEEKSNAVNADYNITDGQRYYMPLVETGAKNVLLIGEDAYSGNYDTIIIASISDKSKKIQLFNFPRDIYIDYSEEVLERLKKKSPKLYEAKGFQKINAVHTVGARIEYEGGNGKFGDSNFDFLADLIEEVFTITIDDYAYVNTKGFREIVDLFDGVDIEVPVRMKYDDPMQDLHIDLWPGMQHLNGKQAEGFVRFRQGYDEDGIFKNFSDQFRKENQNEFLESFFKQHITIRNLGKIDELGKLIDKNILTSIDNVKEVTTYINIFRKALGGKYVQESGIVECSDTENINGIYFDIIRSE